LHAPTFFSALTLAIYNISFTERKTTAGGIHHKQQQQHCVLLKRKEFLRKRAKDKQTGKKIEKKRKISCNLSTFLVNCPLGRDLIYRSKHLAA